VWHADAGRTTASPQDPIVSGAEPEAQATQPAPLGSRKNAVPGGVVTRLLPEAAELAGKPDRRSQPEGAPGPPVSRRQLGALLRQLRFNAGLTIEQVAERLRCTPSKVSRMETSFRAGTLRHIRDLCDLYTVTDQAQRDHLVELARQSKRQGWWQSYDLPFAENVQFGTYLGLEGDATSITRLSHFCRVPCAWGLVGIR
jgi:transcriptional regulator with XRE-family HTH domain